MSKYTTKHKIFVGNRCVGAVVGDVFKKCISTSWFLEKPPALCLSVDSLNQAVRYGAKSLALEVKENGRVYSTSIEHFRRYAFPVQRGGFEPQLGLVLERWDVSYPKVKKTKASTTRVVDNALNRPVQLRLV